MVANHALSQLSYIPFSLVFTIALGVLGLEPRTSALSELRSSQLSYTPRGAKQKAKPNGLALSSRSVRIERQHPLLFARDPLAIDTVLEDANQVRRPSGRPFLQFCNYRSPTTPVNTKRRSNFHANLREPAPPFE